MGDAAVGLVVRQEEHPVHPVLAPVLGDELAAPRPSFDAGRDVELLVAGPAAPRRTRHRRTPPHSSRLGFGADFHEDLLRAMADAGRGSAYYIERTDWASGVKQRASESRRSRHLAKERIRRTEA